MHAVIIRIRGVRSANKYVLINRLAAIVSQNNNIKTMAAARTGLNNYITERARRRELVYYNNMRVYIIIILHARRIIGDECDVS